MSCLVNPPKEDMNTQEHDTTPKLEETAMRSQSDTENMKGNHANLNFSMIVDISRCSNSWRKIHADCLNTE